MANPMKTRDTKEIDIGHNNTSIHFAHKKISVGKDVCMLLYVV